MDNLIDNLSKLNITNNSEIKPKKNVRKENKGIGAGGSNTNKYGNEFERITDNQKYLLENGFQFIRFNKKTNKNDFYLIKEVNNTKIIYLTQTGFQNYCKMIFHINPLKRPDEAYIINKNNKYTIKILEKKRQHGPGSVMEKVYAGIIFKEEFKRTFNNNKNNTIFEIEYAYCLNNYLKNEFLGKKYDIFRGILSENNINFFYGEEEDYFVKLNHWINN
jgi:hypothetical protein